MLFIIVLGGNFKVCSLIVNTKYWVLLGGGGGGGDQEKKRSHTD